MKDTKLLIEHLKTRRSVYPVNYIPKAISKEVLVELLECADQAPNHKMTEPWRFSIFRDQGLAKLANQLTKIYKDSTPENVFLQKKSDAIREKVLRSGAVVAICLHESGKVPRWEEVAAVASAVQNLSLAAAAYGIGSYWSTPQLIQELRPFLDLAENESCIGLFYMGYHVEEPRYGNRSSLEEKLTWIDY